MVLLSTLAYKIDVKCSSRIMGKFCKPTPSGLYSCTDFDLNDMANLDYQQGTAFLLESLLLTTGRNLSLKRGSLSSYARLEILKLKINTTNS